MNKLDGKGNLILDLSKLFDGISSDDAKSIADSLSIEDAVIKNKIPPAATGGNMEAEILAQLKVIHGTLFIIEIQVGVLLGVILGRMMAGK